jgi:asparaginyl-tRNA synthetase
MHSNVATRLRPPRTWREPARHYLVAIEDSWFRLLLGLFDGFQRATDGFWRERGVRSAFASITTGSISCPSGLGSDATPVKVTIGGVETFLTDSQQFPLEYACRLWPEGCYCIMPSFRGDANDARHLGQFFHSEAELPTGLDGLLSTIEDYLAALADFYVHEFRDLIWSSAGTVEHLERLADPTTPFTRLTFDEAARALNDVEGGIRTAPDGRWRTLTNAGERALLDRFGDFVWVTHHDELGVPFFQASDVGADGRRLARNADLLMGIGETVGAGERHQTADEVRAALARHQVPETERETYEWYIRMREATPLRTSGFGLGVERFLSWLLRHDDVRDIQLLARENGVRILP